MKNSKYFKMSSIILGGLLFSLFLFYMGGCSNDSSNPTNNHTADPNVVSNDSIILLSNSNGDGADLYSLKGNLAEANHGNDIVMQGNTLTGNYYLQTASSFGGFECDFILLDSNGTRAKYDTLSKFWGYPDDLIELNNPSSDTKGWGYFSATRQTFIYGFYLKGKYPSVTTTKIFGIIYTNTMSSLTGQELLCVKYNKAGKNSFY